MITLDPLPVTFGPTRDTLQHVAVHIVARARSQSVGKISMRATPGGFGTPAFGPDVARVRIAGDQLVYEVESADDASVRTMSVDGSTLAELAEFAGVDLGADLDVGHDTPPLGDVNARLSVDGAAASALAAWYAVAAAALDRAVALLPSSASPTLVRLWPEHFDVAIDAAATPERRANLGGSPGDGFSEQPYAYVGPWTEDRPSDADFWNAPFGAVIGHDLLVTSADPVAEMCRFFVDGMSRLGS